MMAKHRKGVRDMIKELCNTRKKLTRKKFEKVLAGVLSCCMLLNGCGAATETEISWQVEEEISTGGQVLTEEEISS